MIILRAPEPTAWRRYVAGEPAELQEALERSWSRSLSAGAHWRSPDRSRRAPFVAHTSVRERQEANARTWRHVEPVLQSLAHQLERGGFLGVWADADGVILKRTAGGAFLSTAQRLELTEGADWGEDARGTNAIGTALRERREVAVLGGAHLQQPNHELVCYAAPVRAPGGELLGVLDITSHVACAQDMALAAIVAARRAVELALKLAAYDEELRGGLDGLCQTLELCPMPGLLVERDGTLRAVNARARARFGATPQLARGAWSWSLLERLSHHEARLELRDVQGHPTSWRAIVEPIGPPERPVAALLFLEPPHVATPRLTAPRAVAAPTHTSSALDGLYGDDPAMQQARHLAHRLAPTPLPVLLLAETGTGKERMARALHELAAPHEPSRPFIPVNCGALSKDLLESELFGHAPGAFTGARPQGAPGKIEAADGGTLFLDEVAELSPSAQAMLLRVLEDGTYYRVGDATPRRASVRIIAATCRDLKALVDQGTIRADLYFRLKGARLTLPPLRARHDLPMLATRLLEDLAATTHHPPPVLAADALEVMRAYRWPGNVRELKHTLHAAWVLSDHTPCLRAHHLPDELRQPARHAPTPAVAAAEPPARPTPIAQATHHIRDAAELQALRVALERADGNMSAAARLLGVARSTLYRMMDRHGMR